MLFFIGVVLIALSVLAVLVPDGGGLFRQIGIWIVAVFMGLAGVYFIYGATRKEAGKVDDAFDDIGRGL